MTIIRYTTAPADGPESTVEYDEYEDAVAVAQRFGLQAIEIRYERVDSALLEDFTRYHWLVTARCKEDEHDPPFSYLPDGPDVCCGTPGEALDNLVGRLVHVLRTLGDCEEKSTQDCGPCAACRGFESVDETLLVLHDVDPDAVREKGYDCTVTADPEVPVVYRITRTLLSDCDENNHQ